MRLTPHWIDEDHFWFERTTPSGETEIVNVDADSGSLTVATDESSGATSNQTSGFRGGKAPGSGAADDDAEVTFVNASKKTVQTYWIDSSGKRVPYAKLEPGKSHVQHTYVGHAWEAVGDDGTYFGNIVVSRSKQSATIEQTFPRPANRSRRRGQRRSVPDNVRDQLLKLSEPLDPDVMLVSPSMSPDGKFLAAWKITRANTEPVFTIESSPAEGGRAKLIERPYALPGDEMDRYDLVVWNVADAKTVNLEMPTIDFRRPRIRWRRGHEMLVEKVDRGHQRFRLFSINPSTAKVRTPIDESTDTFIWTAHAGKVPLVTYLDNEDEVIYASEKSGYRHLYLVDLSSDKVQSTDTMRPITQGDYLVREIIHIDESERYADLVVGEYYDDQDPYHRHLIRVGIDDGEVISLTDGDGDHEFEFSEDRRYVIVNHSRVDSPPVHELRRTKDGSLVATLAEAKRIGDEAPPSLPTRFAAKGRDGETDIWGIICFPEDYDADRAAQYPVIEAIYAGPHDSHVPKRYRAGKWFGDLTSLGFIVVRIDGMGTANRSKAFHDVCWHNLKDAGFPDRIAWMKTAAKEHPAMDLSRVGIFGTSAGGQNACGALLFHGDFYRAAVASCGCHDNRMDKASWNEQWMGYPVGPHYAESSNIDNAGNLQGDLLLLVGELDSNVPPESTLRLVDALIKENKRFDFLMIPGMGHSDGGAYGKQRTREFFVEKLKPNSPPSQSRVSASPIDPTDLTPSTIAADALKLYRVDRDLLRRQLPLSIDPNRLRQTELFLSKWEDAVSTLDEAEALELREQIESDRVQLARNKVSYQRWLSNAPFVQTIIERCEPDRRGTPVQYAELATELETLLRQLEAAIDNESLTTAPSKNIVRELDSTVASELGGVFGSWRRFYADYDPQFDWWANDTATKVEEKLKQWRPTFPEQPASPSISQSPNEQTAMFGPNYPDLSPFEKSQGAIMPGIMRQYRADIRSVKKHQRSERLRGWQNALELLTANRPFDSWPKHDQVDYHRLREDIRYRLAVLDLADAPKVIAKSSDGSGIQGTVVGRDRLLLELRRELIDHTPEELIALAEMGYANCRAEMVRASQEMGFGDDWQAAVEKIKNHARPRRPATKPDSKDGERFDSLAASEGHVDRRTVRRKELADGNDEPCTTIGEPFFHGR
ncbi:prolyl oligopeptidase family serine peptidase [Rhodopirellula sallentina]|nr:prolyl oligopeptidase family serine peptidase [Rhodopirellula sallentina]